MLRKCHFINVIAFTLPKIWTDIHPIITDLESKFLHKIFNPETGHFSPPSLLEACLALHFKVSTPDSAPGTVGSPGTGQDGRPDPESVYVKRAWCLQVVLINHQ